ncbi:UDP-glucosyltransferase 2-like isoform X2 [Microplitis mediator]|uniref:UDP-glucosyltransferase 2-like isoform X2 n=1 Tax=Microplitis mediator TaxID=375433 RepID=UPI00255422AF|nr:UDP-glucosyltransferase 2-like isoform X2 [Microplitis mediator]
MEDFEKLKILVLSFLVVINTEQCLGYRILGIFPMNVKSHMVFLEQVAKGLARRGHRVDVLSTFPQKKPCDNYTDILVPTVLPEYVNNVTYDYYRANLASDDQVYFYANVVGNGLCEKLLGSPVIQNLIDNPPTDPPYDIVITEIFAAHCFMAFGYHLKVPVVGLSSSALYPWSNDMIANPPNLAFVPNNLLEYMEKMNFWQRLYNVVHTYYYRMYFNYYTSSQNDMIKKYFGDDAPGVRELEHDLALILTNSHLAVNGPRPTTPALVEVGGLHIQDDDPDIPADHLKWLNESKDGFIYFTFGSMMQIESFPKPVLDILYKSLGKISPIRVFMKAPHPEKLPPGLPKNIRTFTWMPQLKVLKHKNIRAFITHGGLMGTQEAIYSAVPMIGMPLFADQFINVDLYVSKKIAIRLDYADMTEDKLDAALHEILYNPLYRKTVKKISEKFLDRPMSPLDTACYWIEYVIKHGNKALRSSALDLYWWQVALVDVYAVLILTAIIIAFAAIAIFQFISNIVFPSTTVARSKKNN